MPPLRRTFCVLHAWLLALLTLGTGLPHRQCVCPDGGVKWFCLHFAEDRSCCCNSACCAAGKDAAGPTPPASCCCQRHQDDCPGRAPGPARGLGQTPCRKTWLPSSVVSDRPSRDADLAKVAAAPLLLCIPANASETPEGTCEPVRRVNRAPPLPDRVVLFQRLLL